MTPNQERFFLLLEEVPFLLQFWHKGSRTLKDEQFENALGVMSPGEVQIAKFFASVWCNSNDRFQFDAIEAAAKMDQQHAEIVTTWMKTPFWP